MAGIKELYRFCLVFFVMTTHCFAQSSYVRGDVKDLKGEPVSFASVRIAGGTMGTLTDEKGMFDLGVRGSDAQELIITALGYKSQRVKVLNHLKNISIVLEPDIRQLEAILIFPDSSLKALLTKAYSKISDNYPQTPIELSGFYRSYHQSAKNKRYLNFTESFLRIQQSGYHNANQDAQVEVLKIKNLVSPQRDSVDNVRYFGGAFIANWNDPVKMRAPFLNPVHFKKRYSYDLESISAYNQGKDSVYVIRFISMDREETKEGKIWIDKKTMAYQKIEWNDSDQKSFRPLISLKRLTRNYLTRYGCQDQKYVLKYTCIKGINHNTKTDQDIYYALEFITTSIHTSQYLNPIPLEKRLKFSELFSEIKSDESVSFENEYAAIERDSTLRMDRLSISTEGVLGSDYSRLNKSKISTRARVYKLARHIVISYSINTAFIKKYCFHQIFGKGAFLVRS